VDQIGEKRHAPRHHEDEHLYHRCDREHGEADEDRTDTCPRRDDGSIHETVGVTVPVVLAMVDMLWLRPQEAEPQMSVRAGVFVAMNAATVAMNGRQVHGAELTGAAHLPSRPEATNANQTGSAVGS
jgi:hypothetical protein